MLKKSSGGSQVGTFLLKMIELGLKEPILVVSYLQK